MIRVQIDVVVDDITFHFDKEKYSTKVTGGNSLMDTRTAEDLLAEAYTQIQKAIESLK